MEKNKSQELAEARERGTLGVDLLGWMLGVSSKTIYNRLYERPDSIPPRINIPQSNRLLWRFEDVSSWLERNLQKEIPKEDQVPSLTSRSQLFNACFRMAQHGRGK